MGSPSPCHVSPRAFSGPSVISCAQQSPLFDGLVEVRHCPTVLPGCQRTGVAARAGDRLTNPEREAGLPIRLRCSQDRHVAVASGAGGAGTVMKAGATSMWASCCGFLNEVMGTGTVRGQQPAFGGGTGPFRFAHSTGFSAYPSPPPEVPNLVCEDCGQVFTRSRKKYTCNDCKRNFCAFCSVMEENLQRCCTCKLLQQTSFQRDELMKLKVKDLRQYLNLRNIPINTCCEKEDLVQLILSHRGSGADGVDTESIRSQRSQHSQFYTASSSSTSASATTSSQGISSDQSAGSGTSNMQQGREDASFPMDRRSESEHSQASDDNQPKNTRISLSDLSTTDDVEALTVRQLKEILARNFVSYIGCCEKWELVERVIRLFKEMEENRKFVENGNTQPEASVEEKMQLGSDENLCRICMDAMIDCVLLECGHMVTCTKCGKHMNECPICRQYVVRAVHVFKS